MRHLDPDRLVALATGDPERDESGDTHLGECAACRREVTALREVGTLAADTEAVRGLPPAPDRTWELIEAELVGRPAGRRTGRRSGGRSGGREPAVDPPVPTPVARGPAGPGRRRPPEPVRLVLVAVLAVAVTAAGTSWLTGAFERTTDRVADGAGTTVTAEGRLTAGDGAPGAGGMARVLAGRTLWLRVSGLPAPAGYYQVWLVDPTGPVRLPVGMLNGESEVLLPIPAELDLARYRLLEISARGYGDGPDRSGANVLRGHLT